MLAALPKYLTTYYQTLQFFIHREATTQSATSIAFQTLLSKADKKHNHQLIELMK